MGGPSGNARKTLPSSRYYISWVWLYYGHFITHDTRDIKVLVCSSHTRAPAWARAYVLYAQSWLAESKTNENSHYPQGVSPGVTALLLPALIGYALFHLYFSYFSLQESDFIRSFSVRLRRHQLSRIDCDRAIKQQSQISKNPNNKPLTFSSIKHKLKIFIKTVFFCLYPHSFT